MPIILPKTFKKHRDKLFVAQIFIINDQGQISLAGMFPQPTNGKVNGAFLSQIKANFEGPIDSMLQTALQNGECKVMFRIVEHQRFMDEKARAETLQAFNQAKQKENSECHGQKE